jgi:hypothetical protein
MTNKSKQKTGSRKTGNKNSTSLGSLSDIKNEKSRKSRKLLKNQKLKQC